MHLGFFDLRRYVVATLHEPSECARMPGSDCKTKNARGTPKRGGAKAANKNLAQPLRNRGHFIVKLHSSRGGSVEWQSAQKMCSFELRTFPGTDQTGGKRGLWQVFESKFMTLNMRPSAHFDTRAKRSRVES